MALYTLFAARDSTLAALKKWVFSILSNWWEVQARTLRYAGGSYTDLRGFLFYHFFAVAFYSVWLVLAEAPIWMIPYKVVVAIGIIWKASWVIGPYLVWEVMP